MALINPIIEPHREQQSQNIAAALELVGLSTKQGKRTEGLAAKLADHNLDTDSLLSALSDIVHNPESQSIQQRAVEKAMQLNPETRVIDNKPEVPIVNIIIRDGNNMMNFNPILFPREALT